MRRARLPYHLWSFQGRGPLLSGAGFGIPHAGSLRAGSPCKDHRVVSRGIEGMVSPWHRWLERRGRHLAGSLTRRSPAPLTVRSALISGGLAGWHVQSAAQDTSDLPEGYPMAVGDGDSPQTLGKAQLDLPRGYSERLGNRDHLEGGVRCNGMDKGRGCGVCARLLRCRGGPSRRRLRPALHPVRPKESPGSGAHPQSP